MAHFVKPQGSAGSSFTVDNRLAPGSVSKVTLSAGERLFVGLWGGDDLWARSTNSQVAVYDSFNDGYIGDVRVLSLFGASVGSCTLEVGQGGGVWIRLQIEVKPKATKQQVFIIRDVRLEGYKPLGDVLEVDANTPLRWMIDNIKQRGDRYGGALRVILMAHGLPGFIQCGRGSFVHPQAGTGLTVADLNEFAELKGKIEQLSIYSCLVARIGSCPECGGMAGYDGNALCYMLAQRMNARVKASIHLQYYSTGIVGRWFFKRPDGSGITFGNWNGTVYTWGPSGAVLFREQFPYIDGDGDPSDPEGNY